MFRLPSLQDMTAGLSPARGPGARGSSQVRKSRFGFRVVLVLWRCLAGVARSYPKATNPKVTQKHRIERQQMSTVTFCEIRLDGRTFGSMSSAPNTMGSKPKERYLSFRTSTGRGPGFWVTRSHASQGGRA